MKNEVFKIDINNLYPDKDQPRKYFSDEAIDKKMQQLEKNGQKTPIVVYTADENGRYKIHDGELRYRAACKSDVIHSLDAILYSSDSDSIALLVSQLLHNNDGSEPLTPLERAKAYEQIIEDFVKQGSESPVSDAAALLGLDLGEFSRVHNLSDIPEIIENFALKFGIGDSRVLNGMKYVFKIGKDKSINDLFSEIELNEEQKELGKGRPVRLIVRDAKKALKDKIARRKPSKSASDKKQRLLTAQNLSIKSESGGDVLLIETPRERIKIKLTTEMLEELQEGTLTLDEESSQNS